MVNNLTTGDIRKMNIVILNIFIMLEDDDIFVNMVDIYGVL
jgi:hypothetical protein